MTRKKTPGEVGEATPGLPEAAAPPRRVTLLRLLHALEPVTERGVGTLAENALEYVEAMDAAAAAAVAELRRATKANNAQKAMERREKMLREMGLTRLSPASPSLGNPNSFASPTGSLGATSPSFGDTPGSFATPTGSPLGSGARDLLASATSPSSMLGIEDISDDEEDERNGGLVCRVCREGYRSRPRELMGVYCFVKRVESAPCASTSGVRRGTVSSSVSGYATVSHFNAIHFACHASARRADIALRTPKREWEGAALRNSETLCNNLLPVLGGAGVRDSSYRRAAEGWWENVAQVGRQEPAAARLRLALADVAMLLGRFATGANASFSADCHGGGRESNMRVVPHVLRLAAHELAPDLVTDDYSYDDDDDDDEFGEIDDDVNDDDATRGTNGRRRRRPSSANALNLNNADAARRALEALTRGDVAAAAGSVAYPAALALSTLVTTREEWLGGSGATRCAPRRRTRGGRGARASTARAGRVRSRQPRNRPRHRPRHRPRQLSRSPSRS